ncbi:MAG: tRNA guanosine(15) transglycosylase TgtA [Candidatus Thorarchaeota archaeon]|nr:tRNA guanosine(15) transglycosylase TgtA [Candidatus Thorarchaeota archaeon]
MGRFEIKAKDGMARLGRYKTEHGTVKTPLLMPVVHPGKSDISPTELVEVFGFQMIITNSYIIKSQEKFRDIALSNGVHGLLDFDGPIMTDSGTFQMYFHDLPKEEIDPLEIIRFQRSIGTDIGTILDAFSKPGVGMAKVEEDVQLSLERAQASISEKGEMLLAGTVQGGVFPELRERSAIAMAKLNFDVYPIGGVVPLMERYRYPDIVRAVLASKKHLPLDKPIHLFGCGHPMLFAQAALLGCDFFDSASYAKFAYSGRMMLPTGTVHLENLAELPCECPVCSSTSVDELNGLKKEEKDLDLMRHNLYVSAGEIRRVRQAILDGKLMELAAVRARGHPMLYQAFQVMLDSSDQLMQSDPIGNATSILYTGSETSRLPVFQRFHKQVLGTYPYRKTKILILIPDLASNPFSDVLPELTRLVRSQNPVDTVVAFVTPIGIIPWELEHVFPSQQGIFPSTLDPVTLSNTIARAVDFLQIIDAERVIWTSRNTPTNSIFEDIVDAFHIEHVDGVGKAIEEMQKYDSDSIEWTKRKLKAVFSFQWGITGDRLFDSNSFNVMLSRKTGKIRHVKDGDEILFTLVPTTGLLTPTYEGGKRLLAEGISDRFIVMVDDDSAEYVRKGKSALAKFILKASTELLAGEEVLIVDKESRLLGTGRALLTGPEMLQFSRGVAITPRHSMQ